MKITLNNFIKKTKTDESFFNITNTFLFFAGCQPVLQFQSFAKVSI